MDSLKKSLKPKLIIEESDSNSFKKGQEKQEDPCKENLEDLYLSSGCKENMFSSNCDMFLLKKELVERNCLNTKETSTSSDSDSDSLYPNLNDAKFNIKIAEKKEFNSTKYDGTLHENIKERADILSKADFELQPHQSFVKNFLSSQTPYNSLLLFHGLGSGKTLSAIGVCEETRDYLKQLGVNKRIIIVASENVQENFKLQLFDERNLRLVDGNWIIKGLNGNKLLREVNPMNMKGISKEKIVSQVKSLIHHSYLFLGYGQFANYIIKTIHYNEENKNVQMKNDNKLVLDKKAVQRLRNEFDNRLIVIDEIHNIRKTEDNANKKVAIHLEYLVKAAENVRLLLLSATPMYNSYKEIVWLLNLMNMNDRRGRVQVKDIFDAKGDFKDEEGKELLIRKATGYVSFVRGENPYTFPFRVYPNYFAENHTFPFIPYPSYQMNGSKIRDQDKKSILHLYLNTFDSCNSNSNNSKCGECQGCIYKYIIRNLKKKNFNITTKKGSTREMPSFENMESFGYTLLQIPLESLIISYPMDGLKKIVLNEVKELDEGLNEVKEAKETKEVTKEDIYTIDSNELTGVKGLSRMMHFKDDKTTLEKGSFEYKKTTLEKYGKIFSRDIIGKYSCKIRTILDYIFNPENGKIAHGVILIYSQYIDSGLIPMALALEEMGFTRFGENVKPLFKKPPTDILDIRTMKPVTDKKDFMPARYSMITGDTRLSPNNVFEVNGLTNLDNKDGNKVKVVLISKAGSEGIDLKFIRQVHILEPWYNLNRIEQITGRAVRNFSHKDLPFEKRNVQIFMHGTVFSDQGLEEETADLYVYRVAEQKAIQIGHVTRVLKETAIDCILNHEQTNFTQENFQSFLKDGVKQDLSDGQVIPNFKVGDVPFSATCDYMATCNYLCRPNKNIDENNLNEDTYNEAFIVMNSEKILQKIRLLMRENFFYEKKTLFQLINVPKVYPVAEIYSALTQLIDDQNEYILDKYGRNGHLINIGDYYLFQPLELSDVNSSIFDRSRPIDYKNTFIDFEMKTKPLIKKKEGVKEGIKEGVKEGMNEVEEKTSKIMETIIANYQLTQEYINNNEKVPRGDDDWYKHCGIVIKKMSKEYEDSKKYLLEFLVEHMMETLLFEEKVEIMNFLYSLEYIERNSLEWFAKDYFERNSIVTKEGTFFILYHLNKRIVYTLDKKGWKEAEPEDIREMEMSSEYKKRIDISKEDLNIIIGFIGYEKNNRYLIFKTKDMTSKRNTGARCDEAGKQKTLESLNTIVGQERYTKENTKQLKGKDGTGVQDATSQTELCVLQEFLLRYFNKIKRNQKIWFLIPEMAAFLKL